MKRTRIAGAAVLSLLLTACSGSLPDWHYGKKNPTVRIDNGPGALPSAPGSVDPTSPGGATPSALPSGSGSVPGGDSRPGGGISGPGGGAGPGGGGSSQYIANIYKGAADRIGISSSTIKLCGHAALVLGAAFNTNAEDLNVYWQDLASKGGVFGRNVAIDWIDDRYDGAAASDAVVECVERNPFMILGGIGFDQIPFARNKAEELKTLYLHHMAIAQGMSRATYSFSMQPTVEEVGTAFGQFITSKYRSKKVGIISRNSEYWKPGLTTGKKVLDANNVQTKTLETPKNAGSYALELGQLEDWGAQVVWIWENALAAGQIIKQASSQGFRPKWVVFPFQTTLDLIGESDSLNPTIDGIGTWPAYRRGGYGASLFSQYEYDAEIKRFEAAYRKYRPRVTPNDVLWQVWIGNKALHQLFVQCGQDCTRNKIAGLFLGGLKARVNPNCPADFSHPRSIGGRIGLHQFIVLETFDAGSNAAWKTVSWCRERLL